MYAMQKLAIAHAVMVFVGAYIPSIVLFFSTLCLVRSHKDPARTAFTYLKFALLIFSAYAFFDTASYSSFITYNFMFSNENLEDPDFDWGRYATVMQGLGISMRIFDLITQMSEMITDILIMFILLRLSSAILTIHSSSAATSVVRKLQLASYGVAFVLSALALTVLGLWIRFIYEIHYNDYEIGEECFLHGLRVRFVFKLFVFVISLGVIVRSFMVKKQIEADKTLTWASTMLVVASIVWLLHTSFAMASHLAWNNLTNTWTPAPVKYEFYFYIFEAIFGIWPQFVVLAMVYVMGLAKANGIWSRQGKPFTQLEEGQDQQTQGYIYSVPEVPQTVAQHQSPDKHY